MEVAIISITDVRFAQIRDGEPATYSGKVEFQISGFPGGVKLPLGFSFRGEKSIDDGLRTALGDLRRFAEQFSKEVQERIQTLSTTR